MTLGDDSNLTENWLVTWKITWEIWLIFKRAVESLKICTLMGFFLSKVYKVLDEKAQKRCLMTPKSDANFEEKLTLGSEKDMRSLVNFNTSSAKSENLHFVLLLLSKVIYMS